MSDTIKVTTASRGTRMGIQFVEEYNRILLKHGVDSPQAREFVAKHQSDEQLQSIIEKSNEFYRETQQMRKSRQIQQRFLFRRLIIIISVLLLLIAGVAVLVGYSLYQAWQQSERARKAEEKARRESQKRTRALLGVTAGASVKTRDILDLRKVLEDFLLKQRVQELDRDILQALQKYKPQLIELLQDDREEVCGHAAGAIGRLTRERTQKGELVPPEFRDAVPHIIAVLKNKNFKEEKTRRSAVDALDAMGKIATKPLAAALAEDDLKFRQLVLKALRSIGPDAAEATDAIIHYGLRGNDNALRWRAVDALGGIGEGAGKAEKTLRILLEEEMQKEKKDLVLLQKLVSALRSIKAKEEKTYQAVYQLWKTTCQEKGSPTELSDEVIRSFGMLGRLHNASEVVKSLKSLIETKNTLAAGLSLSDLIRENDVDENVRQEALHTLIGSLNNTADPRVRQIAAESLGNIVDLGKESNDDSQSAEKLQAEAIEALINRVKQEIGKKPLEKDSMVKTEIIKAIGRLTLDTQKKKGVRFLTKALGNGDMLIRRQSALALGKLPKIRKGSVEKLIETLINDDLDVQSAAAIALANLSRNKSQGIHILHWTASHMLDTQNASTDTKYLSSTDTKTRYLSNVLTDLWDNWGKQSVIELHQKKTLTKETTAVGKEIDALPEGKFYRMESIQLKENEVYRIDLMSPHFDTYLYVRTPRGEILWDDDGGDYLNSRIYLMPESGDYEIWATSYGPEETGEYTLTVLRLHPEPK